MNIRIRAERVKVTRGLVQDAERQVRRAVGGLARRVAGIGVRLFDANGPRGGVDKVCEVTVRLARAGTVRYRAAAGDAAAAIRLAVAGTRQAVSRRLALRRDLRRRAGVRQRALVRDLV